VVEFQSARCRYEQIRDYETALIMLLLEAIQRRHFQGRHFVFVCPKSECGAIFDQPGKWSNHAVESRHYRDAAFPPHLLPQYDKRMAELEMVMEKGVTETMAKLAENWGVGGSEQRRIVEHPFLHQL
jgi:hypothetical protein